MLTYSVLQIIWFVILGTVLTGYVILGGFDLGIGNLHLFLARTNEEKSGMYKMIGPFWDSNQVWLLTTVGVIFAAFARVYATVFSGFYLLVIVFLLFIVLRSIAIELHHQLVNEKWRLLWDRIFGISSLFISFLLGLASGNIIRGVPLDAKTNYIGTFADLFSPYTLLFGVFVLLALTMHGATFVYARSGSCMQKRVRNVYRRLFPVTFIVFLGLVIWTFMGIPRASANYGQVSIWWVFPVLTVLLLVWSLRVFKSRNDWLPFLNSAFLAVSILWIFAGTLYPNIVPNSVNPANSLTCFNASSSEFALAVMLVITLLALPVVLFYTGFVYRKFSSKVFK